MTGTSALRMALLQAADLARTSMDNLTVLAVNNDPFRLDTPAHHRNGAWLADVAAELGLGVRLIHLRGLHYMILGVPKPDGTPYSNTDADWNWLQSKAGKAARWLGYLPWEQVIDQRNAEPIVRPAVGADHPTPYVDVGLHIEVPDVGDIHPRIYLENVSPKQPFRIVMFGEKSSLEPVLGRISESYDTDLYLAAGELSDTLLHRIASDSAADGRPLVVGTFADADPAGWQMSISVARKLQAFKIAKFPELEFQVHRVGLTPDQVRQYGLPSTPLKASESRADKWKRSMGVEQTEIDALAALRPQLLREITMGFINRFYDSTLTGRFYDAKYAWMEAAQQVVDERMDPDLIAELQTRARARLDELQEEIAAINSAIDISAFDVADDLPTFHPPEPAIAAEQQAPLVCSSWSFVDQTRALIDSKRYAGGDA